MEELISVIIPVYNVEPYLRRCLDSVLAQTYKNLEIIVIDDGSPDYSGMICDQYAEKDDRIKVIHQANGGLCAARNAGMRAATGRYIGFVDSDDWIAPEMYEELYRCMKEKNADIVSCSYFRVKPGRNTYARCDGEVYVYNRKQAMKELLGNFTIRTTFWNKLFRREMFDGLQFPEGRTYEGAILMHKVYANVETAVHLARPYYYYFDNATSIINTRNLVNGLSYVEAHIDRYYEVIADFPELRIPLMTEAIKAIRSMSFVCSHITKHEIEENHLIFEKMQKFIRDNIHCINSEIGLGHAQRKEVKRLAKITPIGFRQARNTVRIQARKMSLIKLFSIKKKVPIIEKPGVVLEEGSEEYRKLRKIQQCEVEIMDEFVRICDKYGLKYYLYGGTLLGAVRHKGFIPWDDDMDIVMPRKDFEKFRKYSKRELSDEYYYQTCFTDKEFPMLFAKLRKKNTYVCEEKWIDKDMEQGIFIDILPLDYFPDSTRWGNLVLHGVSFLHQAAAFENCKSGSVIAHLLFRILKILPCRITYWLRDWLLKFSNRFSHKNNICSFGSHYMPMIQRVLKAEWFGEGQMMEFEGKMYRVPSMWESYLLHLFGKNYMKLPPVDDRRCHLNLYQTIVDPEEYKRVKASKAEVK